MLISPRVGIRFRASHVGIGWTACSRAILTIHPLSFAGFGLDGLRFHWHVHPLCCRLPSRSTDVVAEPTHLSRLGSFPSRWFPWASILLDPGVGTHPHRPFYFLRLLRCGFGFSRPSHRIRVGFIQEKRKASIGKVFSFTWEGRVRKEPSV